MTWSFRLATIAGTEIRIHLTFLLLVGWYGYDAWQSGGPEAARASVIFLLLVFLCILLHEFGHIGMARRFGIRTPDVLLSPIGGVARLERMPEEPRQELLVALAGPLVTLLIAAGLWGVMQAFNTSGSLLSFDPGRIRLLPSLFQVNVFLLAFNLIPAFPMDGGRVLRALLASRIGMVRGTRIAARTGQIFAFAFAGIGLWSSSFLLLIIAGFIYLAAGAEANAVETRAAGRGMTTAEIMVTDLRTLRVHATLGDAAALLLAAEQREFPVVDNDGRLEGLLTRDDLVRGLASHGVDASVQTVITVGIEPLTVATPFDEAVRRLRGQRLQAIPVVTDDRQVVGMVTSDNLTDLILLQPHLRPGTWSR